MPTKDFILEALLQHNYLPVQKKSKDEIPPVFTTISLTPKIAEEVAKLDRRKDKTYGGYDQVEYRATRFNNVPRKLSLPHPKPYIDLAFCIHENWKSLNYICKNDSSLIYPKQHRDGRTIIMDYEKSWEKSKRHLSMTIGSKFSAHTDIASCFPSVYSHAIPWALVGFTEAKKKKGPKYKSEWFNQLDEYQRMLQRNETQGVPIGPATSNIIAEAILARIDEKLKKEFNYVRFIDDYTCYCEKYEDAEEFIRRLDFELSKYNYNLNIKKTTITPLPKPVKSDWVIDLMNNQPKGKDTRYSDAINYIDYAVSIHRREQDGSILKFAVNSISKRLKASTVTGITEYVLSLSFYYPILIPALKVLFEEIAKTRKIEYEEQLNKILKENIINHRSDGMCWSLFYLLKYDFLLDADAAESVIKTKDCLSILIVYLFGKFDKLVIDFLNGLDADDLYGLDQYWPLIYQLYKDGKFANPYKDDDTFDVLKKHNVSFVLDVTSGSK